MTDARPALRKVWQSKTCQSARGAHWIWDGNRIAWSEHHKDKLVFDVDLDAEAGKPKEKCFDRNKFRVELTRSGQVDFSSIEAFISGRADKSNEAISAVTCLDHIIREFPSRNMTSIKRSFFSKAANATHYNMFGGLHGMKGAYAAIKLVHHGANKTGPVINVDVTNAAFYNEGQLGRLLGDMTGCNSPSQLQNLVVDKSKQGRLMEANRQINRLHVYTKHQVGPDEKKVRNDYIIKGFAVDKAGKKFWDANTFMIKIKDHQGNLLNEKSVAAYYQEKHGTTLKNPSLPLIEMVGRTHTVKGEPIQATVLPIELLHVDQNTRFPYKLNDKQTADMIKFAVSAPNDRWNDIAKQVNALDWTNDKALNHYGIKISTQPTVANATLLHAPSVMFGAGGKADPGTSGRWDLRGKKFYAPASKALKNWSVVILGGSDVVTTTNFVSVLVRSMKGHGMRVVNERPKIELVNPQIGPSKIVEKGMSLALVGPGPPELVVFVLFDKNLATYSALKHFAELGVIVSGRNAACVTQCVQSAHVGKAQPQYCSNVAMKINAKLGGATCIAKGARAVMPAVKNMIIGCDVSHAAPGQKAQSVAALTVSWDLECNRYLAVCASNGDREEIVQQHVFDGALANAIKRWVQTVGGGQGPTNVFYMRDGVSEGQYSQVVQRELEPIRALFQSYKINPKFTAMICSKRHHVRMFPQNPQNKDHADKNGNVLPGTLVEYGVTDPRDFDFYLCAHAAIKGTARPVHYYVLHDEVKLPAPQLQQMIYEHSYQYVRATTPISQHPSLYYAHLAAARATAHVPERDLQINKHLREAEGRTQTTNDSNNMGPPLEKISDMIASTMWYV